MKAPRAFPTATAGFNAATPAERASFGMLASTALSIAIARGINYWRERRRRMPTLRSLARRVYHAPRAERPRVHRFAPGILVLAGAARRRSLRAQTGASFGSAFPSASAPG
jgi:hypothetical protein